MEVNVANIRSNRVVSELIGYLQEHEEDLALSTAQLYYDFPLYRDEEGGAIAASVLIASAKHGIIAIQALNVTDRQDVAAEISKDDKELGKVFSHLFSRLIREKQLQRTRTELEFPFEAFCFAPNLDNPPATIDLEFPVCINYGALSEKINVQRIEELDANIFGELIAVIEGAKGMIRPHPRDVAGKTPASKGQLANKVEQAILGFDRQQKRSSIIGSFDGPQRIRGLAGSGKTVVLALKAALTHLKDPQATIVYTFYTRSLYQHIRRLITRFYRQYDDRDPDWTKLRIMHAWGGKRDEGVYYNTCLEHGITPLTYSEARQKDEGHAFDYVCKTLLKTELHPVYDYVFVDEGQDFPASFIRLCAKISKEGRFVWAYDDLQTIFQPHAPEPKEVFGVNRDGTLAIELDLDTVLHKCYRNPREVLVIAHALGFGLYGKIVQMLENAEHWEDIGYVVHERGFTEGAEIVIERPEENSLTVISETNIPNEIVQVQAYENFDQEVNSVSQSIEADIQDGLRPDDILVIVVDDRAANSYLQAISTNLALLGIASNNIHSDTYNIRDFRLQGQVTLSTVHKAKGNEAFMVYVIGVDALFASRAGVRERNMLFTAMTRAKGWVRVSGIGEWAAACKQEINTALANFPYLRFRYPSEEELKIMKRDLTTRGAKKSRSERLLEEVLQEMDPDEIKRFIEHRSLNKKA